MSVSSNEVTVTSSIVTGMRYVPDSLVITAGESSTPPATFSREGEVWTITLGADRKNSAPVADNFNMVTGGSGHQFAPNGGGGSPKDLNFFFGVEITFRTTAGDVVVPVYLGQGKSGFSNNWWIGGNAVVNTGTPVLLVIADNKVVLTLQLSGGNSSFIFTPA